MMLQVESQCMNVSNDYLHTEMDESISIESAHYILHLYEISFESELLFLLWHIVLTDKKKYSGFIK